MKTLAFFLTSLTVLSHDMWIEPATFAPQPGSIVAVKLRVGQDLMGDPIPRSASLIREFVVADGTGKKPLVGREGSDPAGLFLSPVNGGGAVVGYYSQPSPVEMAADKFNAYVQEEGLRGVAARGPKVREQFTRCAKSLVQSNDRVLGFPLEILAEAGGAYKLIYQSKPLAGALVVAMRKGHPESKVSARTDAAGRVRLRLDGDGMWLIKSVHMIPADNPAAEWQSYWASLTFLKGAM